MKIGIISDIHGNLPALSAVLETLDRMSVSGVVCAGDIAGYYPFVNEVIAELMRVDAVAIMGNHDHALVRGTDIPESRSATEAIRFARDRILPGNLEYLASLPAMRELRIGTTNITLFHGTPADPLNGRIRTGEDLSAGGLRTGLVVGGHTHVPAEIRRGGVLFLNPGSCGQPRDFDIRASCAVVDLDTMEAVFPRVFYDIDSVEEKMSEYGFDPRIAWALYTGEWVGSSRLSPSSELVRPPEMNRTFEAHEYRYCLHLRSRKTSCSYNCYILDKLSRLVTAPCYPQEIGTMRMHSGRIKMNAGAVAAYKVLEDGNSILPKDFDELDGILRSVSR